jgi:diguanylate cyclase (GGDEF)-like protein
MRPDASDPFPLDPFTKLPTRAFLRHRLTEEYDTARGLRRPLSVLAVDLDHFREINDRHFLPGGDQVLLGIVRLISALARPGDLVVRDGGDQFSLMLIDTDADTACKEAERIRAAIASAPIEVLLGDDATEVHVTVCIGVATLVVEDTQGWDLFVRARVAVHDAKDLGRNRVVLAGPSRPE